MGHYDDDYEYEDDAGNADVIGNLLRRQPCLPTKSSNLICNAGDEQKEEVYTKSTNDATEKQNASIKDSNPKSAAATTRLDLSVWPDSATIFGALGMTEGGYKYSAYNYRISGVCVSTYIAAMERHKMKFFNGEWADEKTKVPHLASMISCIGIIIDGFVKGNVTDDRPPAADISELLESMEDQVRHLQKIFPDPKPKCTELQSK